jgi:hypothetical protein
MKQPFVFNVITKGNKRYKVNLLIFLFNRLHFKYLEQAL